MTAWVKWTAKKPPRNKMVLFRTPQWDCPCIIKFMREGDETWWGFCESVLADIAGAVNDDELKSGEWALMPE